MTEIAGIEFLYIYQVEALDPKRESELEVMWDRLDVATGPGRSGGRASISLSYPLPNE